MVAWGDWTTCVRGNELVTFADSLGLVIANNGSEPTFVGRGAGSIVDVTFVSESLVPNVNRWRVKTEVDNGSDHQSISFQISSQVVNRALPTECRGWDTSNSIDLDLLRTGLMIDEWISPGRLGGSDVNTMADDFKNLVSTAADFAIPAKKSPRGHKALVHWWNSEIGNLRRACNARKRGVRRAASRRRLVQADGNLGIPADVLTTFREARKALWIAIRRSKALCWDQMVHTVDSDP